MPNLMRAVKHSFSEKGKRKRHCNDKRCTCSTKALWDGEDNISIDLQRYREMFQSNERVVGGNLQIHKIPLKTANGHASFTDRFSSCYCTARFYCEFLERSAERRLPSEKKKKNIGENGRASPRREEGGGGTA